VNTGDCKLDTDSPWTLKLAIAHRNDQVRIAPTAAAAAARPMAHTSVPAASLAARVAQWLWTNVDHEKADVKTGSAPTSFAEVIKGGTWLSYAVNKAKYPMCAAPVRAASARRS